MNKPLQIENNSVNPKKQVHSRPERVIAPDISVKVVESEKDHSITFGFNEEDYLALLKWMADVLRFIKSQDAVIDTYESDVEFYNGLGTED